ncbi:Uncharacterised protein [Mycobacteroides abscessus subsp. massiliense]|uniref:hypothetical protein n=1 Tax=Mycobacteroides abscessus TaxID=36809 RepID=UPI0009A757D7|nr:hypothetical protein [Mycobacteroides abscessus]SKR01580.1 Uncharacterised protein [Mycobacteroides abscessus subsp. massiliense]SKR64258.1 Uncharacterised protein [Mycobacteroides abscessus subsp. massiliense]SKT48059.1 Uncharacterised protein [Mycobacteroides abscessus subsp. massiliense]SKT85605.1 Uncharacterised protein [Mycobacteroides abscessus subsp. massiliense]SLA27941.1 Uncharacterised protein [Mycobacteroides abscessus subsp. massiliense]
MTTEVEPAATSDDNRDGTETALESAEETDNAVDKADTTDDTEETSQTGEAKKGDAVLLRRVFGVLLRKSLIFSVILAAAAITIVALGWLLHSSQRSERAARAALISMQNNADAQQRARQIALNYSRGAAEMDFKDIPGWTKRLTANTSPELTKKLKDAATSMEQIIVPLQWVSTPTPITSAVRSEHDGIFVVNSFLSIMTKNVQAPNGVQSTATYTVTINSKDNWIITDVGGVDSAMSAGK